jgi:hypothetical protein
MRTDASGGMRRFEGVSSKRETAMTVPTFVEPTCEGKRELFLNNCKSYYFQQCRWTHAGPSPSIVSAVDCWPGSKWQLVV